MEILENKTAERDYSLERLIMLSDGVFAIAITLLALELRPPEDWDRSLTGLVYGMWRPAAAFLVSFIVIGLFWMSHRRMFGRFRSADMPLTVLNLFLLGTITLVPVATNLVYEGGPASGGFIVYVVVLSLIGLSNALLWAYVAFLNPALFAHEPPKEARVMALIVQLIFPILVPLTYFVTSGALPIWTIGFLALFAVGIRVLKSRMTSAIDKEWRP
jgi:uncharacterized membrane protein